MTIQLPPDLLEVYELAGDGRWPQGDEDALRAVADSHSEYARAVESHQGDAIGSVDEALESVEGKLHDSLTGIRLKLGNELREVSQAHSAASVSLQQAANAVEHTKGMMVSSLAILKSELATARAMEPFTCGAARAAETAAIAATRLAIATLAEALTGELAASGALPPAAAIETVAMDSFTPSDASARNTTGAGDPTTTGDLTTAGRTADAGGQNPSPGGSGAAQPDSEKASAQSGEKAEPTTSPTADTDNASRSASFEAGRQYSATTSSDTANTAPPASGQSQLAGTERAAAMSRRGAPQRNAGPNSVAREGSNNGSTAKSLLRAQRTPEKASREASASHGAKINTDRNPTDGDFEHVTPNAAIQDLAPTASETDPAGRFAPGTMGQNLSELAAQGQQLAAQGQQGVQQLTQTIQQASQQNSIQAAQSMMSEAGDTERFSLGKGAESLNASPQGALPAGATAQGAGAGLAHSQLAPATGTDSHLEAASTGRAGNGTVPTALRPPISQGGAAPMGPLGANQAQQQQRTVSTPAYLHGTFDGQAPPIAVIDSVIGQLSPEEQDETEDRHTFEKQRDDFRDEVHLDGAEWPSGR